MTSTSGPGPGDLWAITCYFNPVHYRRRLQNFRIFRKDLQVPLVAVELAYGPDFELQAADAEILIQLRGGAVLWQKERLLNLALQALPGCCQKVAWLDCDIIFERPEWIELASRLLDQCAVLQLFRRVHHLGPQWAPGKDMTSHVEFPQQSAGFGMASGISREDCLAPERGSRKAGCATGLAWAARREVLDRHSFFDAGILGGGDRAMACAAHQCCDELMQIHCMNEQQRRRYISWAEPYFETVRADTSFVDVDLFHLWHGDHSLRKGRVRHEGLQRFRFDPYTDVAIDANGAWRWDTDKREMHEYVQGYFASRSEDG